jgi:nitrogen-specific signal transduction histidine kinase/CheY-like chemotaxis protein
VRDITERKRAEQEALRLQDQLTQAQKMESVGRLAGGVAHDFNNMLGVILGHADLALKLVDRRHPLHSDLLEIRRAAERSAELTRQLLAFARKQTAAPQVLDLNEMVDGMLKMLRRMIGEDIDLSWSPSRKPMRVRMDPSQLDQVLANLCVNARDAITGVGKITIGTRLAELEDASEAAAAEAPRGEYAALFVKDDGCGMDRQTLERIFEPFFTTKPSGQGTGLGLATIYGIVKQNGGFIRVESEPGKGSTFQVHLPLHKGKAEKKDAPAASEQPSRLASGGTGTVLLVEDEPAILALGRKMLQLSGFRVLDAENPTTAIDIADAQEASIDLLITDVVMPEMNGRELGERIRLRHPETRLLFMSGYTADVIAHQGVLDEGVHFIQKPFTMSALASKVRQVLGQ